MRPVGDREVRWPCRPRQDVPGVCAARVAFRVSGHRGDAIVWGLPSDLRRTGAGPMSETPQGETSETPERATPSERPGSEQQTEQPRAERRDDSTSTVVVVGPDGRPVGTVEV